MLPSVSSSLLTRDESTGTKGLLIFLVVLGHNSLAMEYTGLYSLLYSFHVYCFYILPFLYGATAVESCQEGKWRLLLQRTWKNFRFFYPLLILWSLVSLSASMARGGGFPGIFAILRAFLFEGNLLRETFGFGFLWFMPTMVSVLFWRDLYFCFTGWRRALLFWIGVCLWGLSLGGIVDYRVLGHILPFALLFGLYFAMQGIAVRWLLLQLPDHPWIKWLTPIAFLTIPGFLLLRGHLPGGCLYLTWSLLPIIGFCCLYPWRTLLGRLSFLKFLGRHSLGIYLIHVFLYNAYLLLVPWHHPLNALLSFLITLGMTCAMVLLLNRCHLGWCIGTRPQRRTL